MKHTVCIDGQHGTTGLKIHERLEGRDDLDVIEIPEAGRKDPAVRQRYLNEAEIVFLCLPDDAARESVSLIDNPAVRIIDASTAHRTQAGWVYGIPELNPGQRVLIGGAKRVSVPGCYATGFSLCLHPLVAGGIVPADYPVGSYAVTGYSGGGRKMIEDYEAGSADPREICCRPKNLNLAHKHLPEMQKYGLLARPPQFIPIVGNFYQGMLVFIPLFLGLLASRTDTGSIRRRLEGYYAGEQFVRVVSAEETEAIGEGFLSPLACNGSNRLEIFIFARGEQVLLVARLDNLGKGASGAAVQNMNLMLGTEESEGL